MQIVFIVWNASRVDVQCLICCGQREREKNDKLPTIFFYRKKLKGDMSKFLLKIVKRLIKFGQKLCVCVLMIHEVLKYID